MLQKVKICNQTSSTKAGEPSLADLPVDLEVPHVG